MANETELISSSDKKRKDWEAFRGGLGEPGVFIGLYLRMSLLISA